MRTSHLRPARYGSWANDYDDSDDDALVEDAVDAEYALPPATGLPPPLPPHGYAPAVSGVMPRAAALQGSHTLGCGRQTVATLGAVSLGKGTQGPDLTTIARI
eukprot:342759-Prymnesium_polylepis.1